MQNRGGKSSIRKTAEYTSRHCPVEPSFVCRPESAAFVMICSDVHCQARSLFKLLFIRPPIRPSNWVDRYSERYCTNDYHMVKKNTLTQPEKRLFSRALKLTSRSLLHSSQHASFQQTRRPAGASDRDFCWRANGHRLSSNPVTPPANVSLPKLGAWMPPSSGRWN